MRSKLRLFFLIFSGAALAFTGCSKLSDPTLKDPVLTPQVVAGQVALNLNQSLFGGLGAFDVSAGLNAPSGAAVNTGGRSLHRSVLQKRILQGLTNPYCGLTIDTTVNYSYAVNDTTASVSGTIKFAFTCNNSVVNGYTTNDNLSILFASPQLALTYKVAENLTLLSLDPSNPNSNFSLSGTLNSNGSYQFKTGSQRSGTQIFNYTLTNLVYDPVAGDIVSGSGSFVTSGSGPQGLWSYQGTITFLGNHAATVTIGGKSYSVTV
jgi:hypothetical protein